MPTVARPRPSTSKSEYLNRALRFAEHHDLTDEEQMALDMWEYVLTHLEDDPLKLDRELDWVIKYKLIDAYRERHDLSLSDAGRPGRPAVPRCQP